MNSTEKMELQVTEDTDGSATVLLDEPLDDADEGTPAAAEAKAEGGAAGDDSEDDQPTATAAGDDDEDGRQRIREVRRQERQVKKQVKRQRIAESQVLINALRKQNEDLAARLASVEKRTSGAELARIDKAIEDSQLRQEYAKAKIQEAMQAQDGAAMVKAQEMLFESKQQLEQLAAFKKQTAQQANNPSSNIKLPNHTVQALASQWMKQHNWYDPNLKNTDSKVARSIDEELTQEGWDPATPDYWDELDNRLQQYLPHRYASGYNSENRESDTQQQPTTQRPRSMVTGTGREATGGSAVRPGEFRLSAERVQAMKEAGIWDNAEKRAKMIKHYAAYDRANKRSQ